MKQAQVRIEGAFALASFFASSGAYGGFQELRVPYWGFLYNDDKNVQNQWGCQCLRTEAGAAKVKNPGLDS